MAHDLTAGRLLLPPAAVLFPVYRAWVSERAKHKSLEFLNGVTRSLSRGGELESELLDLLRRTRSSFRVETAELVILPGPAVGALRTARRRGGVEEVMVPVASAPAAALRALVGEDSAVRVDRERCDAALRTYLIERGISHAMIAPVRGETRLAGVMLLGDRVGAGGPFTAEDLRLFEALAAHAGLSLELDRLERQAQSDPLTGLANRALFLRRVEASLERGSGMATVLFLDLDGFKAINDRAGHAAGDAVLVAAAGRIEASVRPGDVAARMGGDEFAVLLEDVDDHHGEQVAARVLDLLAEPVVLDGEELWVRSSVGIATAAASSGRVGRAAAPRGRGHVPRQGGGQEPDAGLVPEMQPAGEAARTGRDEVAEALRRDELVAHFQPIASLCSGSDVAAEALVRWRHPRLGLLGAGSFLRDASGDLAVAVDREVLFQACTAAADGLVPCVHVNLASLDAGTVRDVLESTGLDPARLALGLCERALAGAPADGLAALRTIGVRIAFDDFGAGHHGVELLRSRPVDMLKIARPFVDGAGRAGHERAVLAMVVQLGAMFGLQAVAQGIEREDQREALASLGCELGQAVSSAGRCRSRRRSPPSSGPYPARSMPRMKTQLTPELADYLARHSRQDEVLARVERETAEMPRAQMATTPDEAALLTMLARLVGARSALEIGTFTGYGAISIARGLAEGGRLTCLEVSEEYAEIARRNLDSAGVLDRVEIVVGAADEALRAMPEEPTFDYVFIDADKTAYPTYYDLVVPRLMPGGLLLLDNVFLGGDVVEPEDHRARIMDELNDRVTADERVDSAMVFVADGLTLVRKR